MVTHSQTDSKTKRTIYISPPLEYAAHPVYGQFFKVGKDHWPPSERLPFTRRWLIAQQTWPQLPRGSCRGGTAVRSHPQLLNGRLRSTTALSRSAPTEVLLAFLEAHSSLTPSAAQNVRRPWKTEEPRRTAILCFCCFGSQVLRQPHRLPRSAAATSTTTTRILSVIEEGMCLNAAAPPAAP